MAKIYYWKPLKGYCIAVLQGYGRQGRGVKCWTISPVKQGRKAWRWGISPVGEIWSHEENMEEAVGVMKTHSLVACFDFPKPKIPKNEQILPAPSTSPNCWGRFRCPSISPWRNRDHACSITVGSLLAATSITPRQSLHLTFQVEPDPQVFHKFSLASSVSGIETRG